MRYFSKEKGICMKTALLFTGLVALIELIAGASNAEESAFRTKFDREITPGQPVLTCTRVQKGPEIDGELEKDPVWQTCARTHGAWTQLATKNASPRQTVVYSSFDMDNLYFGFVCEEPELQNVRMDGAITGNGPTRLGDDDCVEVVLEIGGVQGDGEVYSFRANPRAQTVAWGLASIPSTPGQYRPDWKSAGKFGNNRWMLEMAIPFASLKRRIGAAGISAPKRGDVFGIKLARYGSAQANPDNRMISTFNTDIAYSSLYLAGANGLLYFEDANVLHDGKFIQQGPDSVWQQQGPMQPLEGGGGMSLKAGAELRQKVELRQGGYYKFIADPASGEALEASINGKPIKFDASSPRGFFADAEQPSVVFGIKATRDCVLKSVELRYQPGEEPPGALCLTNNYRTSSRNLRARSPGAPDGRYQYVEIDYLSKIIGDQNPAIKQKHGAVRYDLRFEDAGGQAGWIPFSKGSLTGKPEPIFWVTANPDDKACWGRIDHTIDIDLGDVYFVTGLDVLWPAPNIWNFEVWGKERENDEWILLHADQGPLVDPAKVRNEYRAYESIRKLDSAIRYVRWRAMPWRGDYTYPQMCGIQEFWVWGEPKGQRKGLKPFTPWIPSTATPAVPWKTSNPDRENCLIVPQPRKMEVQPGWFTIHSTTRIVIPDTSVARKTAELIQEEIRRLWNLEIAIESESQHPQSTKDTIHLSQLGLGGGAETAQTDTTLKSVPDLSAQGYGLVVTPDRIEVLGVDGDGQYWGVQSLMMAMRWRNDADESRSGPSVRCMRVLDWPEVLERGLINVKSFAAFMAFPETELHRARRICQLLSRFKFNVLYLHVSERDGEEPSPEHPAIPPIGKPGCIPGWTAGTLSRLCREMRDTYHIEIRPAIFRLGHGNKTWRVAAQAAGTDRIIEVDPDEAASELSSAVNLCPVDPQSYDAAFRCIDQIVERFGEPSQVWMNSYIYSDGGVGARWSVCRKCQQSGLSANELYKLFLSRTAGHLSAMHCRPLMDSRLLSFGESSPKHQSVALDIGEVPESISILLPDSNDAETFIQKLKTAVNPARTANGPAGWPSRERFIEGPWTESELVHCLAGGFQSETPAKIGFLDSIQKLWYGPSTLPSSPDRDEMGAWLRGWFMGNDFPAWRRGEAPKCVPLDLRQVANHQSHSNGKELLQPGRTPELDLRYMPKGKVTLAGVEFDIIDPDQNGGKGVLMLGRPLSSVLPEVAQTIAERCAPITVNRKLASLAFLRGRWNSSVTGILWEEAWLRPTCRVIYNDNTWLVVDAFLFPHAAAWKDEWTTLEPSGCGIHYRTGWVGNTPRGGLVGLPVVEWVNPYPEKTIRCIDFFVPEVDGRRNTMCEAIIAISGVEPTAFDLAFWGKRENRQPCLPLRTEDRPGGVLLKIAPKDDYTDLSRKRHGKLVLSALGDAHSPEAILHPNTDTAISFDGSLLAYSTAGFAPFGFELKFQQPESISRIDVSGPYQQFGGLASYMPRTQKVDVTVEVTYDGENWEAAGQPLRGIASEADYQWIDVSRAPLRGIRFKGDASAYRDCYQVTQYWGGMFTHITSCPHFLWRLAVLERK